MSTGSRRTTSAPPPASSWAAPPEFYIDVNLTGNTLRRLIEDLGYVVHTPAQLYGDRSIGEVMSLEIWLRDVGPHRCVVLGRDTTILKTPHELAAYKAARIHMFLIPGKWGYICIPSRHCEVGVTLVRGNGRARRQSR